MKTPLMHSRSISFPSGISLIVAVMMLLPTTRSSAQSSEGWTFDLSLYALAAGMSGDMTVKGIDADLDVGFDKIWNNLEAAGMGTLRVGYDRWAFTTDVVYMGLGGSKNGVSADLDQWMVQPTLSYRFHESIELLAGTRYNNISGELRGPGVLPTPIVPSGTQDWWDPIVGANVSIPMGESFSANLHADVGGFGVASDVTWQAFPFVSWHFTEWGSLQVGYRWMYTDYETGSGARRFAYDMTTQGPQLGFTLHF